ncbi:hypothetical protein RDWZM_002841 [Blomia tropicalis]|uniref:Elongation of very long chain fatty acids protein n=1 Tax=Blomia tropicalis TaxID=40697 RepID=A0A9Q0ME71_BLOTA|nr:hypothetical protein RDWZM_002841 [Blomia tropicalis]
MQLISQVWTILRYSSHDYWIETADPRTLHFPLVQGGPWKVLTIVALYLLFVKKIGPEFMKNRPAYVLRGPMLLYNMFMVVTNIFFFTCLISRIDYGRRFLNFKFPDPDDHSFETLREIKIGYLCYLSRFLDLLDTVFFVLRKKNNQITFLHLYHHTLVPIIGYMAVKIAPQAPVIGLFLMFNTLIHSVMYLYYALASFGPTIQKYLWWKKYITQLQLLQFACCGVYAVFMVFLQEGFPPGLFWLGFAQNPFFFYMFYDFYKKAYNENQAKKSLLKTNGLNGYHSNVNPVGSTDSAQAKKSN